MFNAEGGKKDSESLETVPDVVIQPNPTSQRVKRHHKNNNNNAESKEKEAKSQGTGTEVSEATSIRSKRQKKYNFWTKDATSKRETTATEASEATSQRSKRQQKHHDGTKDPASKRPKKKHKYGMNDLSNRSKRQPKTDTASAYEFGTTRQKQPKCSLEKEAGELVAAIGIVENLEPHTSLKETTVEPKFHKVKRIQNAEKPEAPAKHLCSETFGYGQHFLNSWLEEPRTIEFKVEPPKKVPVIKVSKTLVVYEVPQELSTEIEIGDILYKFNDLTLTTRDEYTRQLALTMKILDAQNLTFTILRPIKSKQIPERELSDVFSKLQQPQGFDIVPAHFEYLTVFLTVAPKTILGVTIKGYNGKVYVSGIINKLNSIAYKCLLVGDAILAIEDRCVSGVKDTGELLSNSFAKKKFVRLIIERAKTPAGLKNVKLALSVEKTFEINPRMTEDIMEICQRQIKFMLKYPDLKANTKIYHQQHPPRATNSHVDVARESRELPISTDVNNIQLLAPAPPVPSVAPGTIGFYNPLEMLVDMNTPSKRALKKRTTK